MTSAPVPLAEQPTSEALDAAVAFFWPMYRSGVSKDQVRKGDIQCQRLALAFDRFLQSEGLQRIFDLQWEADQRAIKRWQEAHPGNDLVWPDRANMVVWLMEQHGRLTADLAAANERIARLEGALRDIAAMLTP